MMAIVLGLDVNLKCMELQLNNIFFSKLNM